MKQKIFFSFIMLLSIALFACQEDEVKQTNVTVNCNLPEEFTSAGLSDIEVTVKNISTGKTSSFTFSQSDGNTYSLTLIEGLYDFSLEGDMNSIVNEIQFVNKVKGYKDAVEIIGSNAELTLDLFLSEKINNDFVIAEIFFTGTLTPEGKQYLGDSYFRIYNNSDQVLYADGLVIAESKFLTTAKRDYTPDIMSDAVAVDAIYRIPGSGTDYPVEPGKSILICDNAIDHRNANVNSFDLRTANFEWYDESTNPSVADIDNPAVANLEKIYCYTLTIWVPHNRGFNSYVLGRLGIDKETYLTDYTYFYDYNLVTNAGTFPMTGDAYKFPNEWVIDAVNLSIEAKFEWLLTHPSLDMGWSYCGKIDSDKTRYGKSVRRKVLSITDDGRKILKDTNNSSVDFDAEQTADPFYFN